MPTQSEDYYGAPTASDTKTLRERLRDYYSAEDFVTVFNCDTKPITYQFMPPQNQQFISNAPYHGETHNVGNPQRITLEPGETKLCPAYEADLMIEALVKQITSTGMAKRISEGKDVAWQSANWTDPQTQTRLIKEIYLGKQDLIGKYNDSLQTPVNHDLDVAEEPQVVRPGRPRKTV